MLAEEKRNHEHKEHSTSNNHPQTEERRKFVNTYQGDKGIKLTKNLKGMVNKVLPENVRIRISFKAEKLKD